MKTNYPKIDIFYRGRYVSSTTWAKTCKEAKSNYIKKFGAIESLVKANYSK